MKLITQRDLIRTVAKRWAQQYPRPQKLYGGDDSSAIQLRLDSLDPETASAKEVEDIIGNIDWVMTPICGECGLHDHTDRVVVGEPPDWESNTAYLCRGCATRVMESFT